MGSMRNHLRRTTAIVALGAAMFAAVGPAAAAPKEVTFSEDSLLPKRTAVSDTTAVQLRVTLPGVLDSNQITLNQVIGQARNEAEHFDQDALRREHLAVNRAHDFCESQSGDCVALDGNRREAGRATDADVPQKTDLANAFALSLKSLSQVPSALRPAVDTVESLLNNNGAAKIALARKSGTTNCGDAQTADTSGLNAALPLDIGHVKLGAGASKITCVGSMFDLASETALTQVKLNLASLVGSNGQLAAVGDALRTLTTQVNSTVLPVVNQQVDTAKGVLEGVLPEAGKKELDKLVTIGHIKELPNLDAVDLLSFTVLGSNANISPLEKSGRTSFLAKNDSKVVDVSVLGGWAKIGVIGLSTETYANGNAADAIAKANVKINEIDLGGLLGINLQNETLRDLADVESTKAKLEALTPEAAKPALQELFAAVDLLYNIAGLDVEIAKTKTLKGANQALAEAGTVTLRLEPKLPDLAALTAAVTSGNGVIPRLTKDQFKSAGVIVEVDFPTAASQVAIGKAQGVAFARTGIGTPWLIAMALIGLALVVRRFAVAK